MSKIDVLHETRFINNEFITIINSLGLRLNIDS